MQNIMINTLDTAISMSSALQMATDAEDVAVLRQIDTCNRADTIHECRLITGSPLVVS